MELLEQHGELVVLSKNTAMKALLEKAPTMCGVCHHRPAEVSGTGGPMCRYCDDQIDL